MRAEALAVAAADDLHGYGQQHLLGEHIRQEEPVALEEGDLGVVQFQANLFLPGYGLHGPVIEIEVAAHLLDYRLQAARTGNLHASMQFAGNTDLAVHHFRGCPKFERIGLAKVARMIIDRARRVTLVQTQLMQRQFFDIEEHTGNLRERKVIIRCTRALSTKVMLKWTPGSRPARGAAAAGNDRSSRRCNRTPRGGVAPAPPIPNNIS